MIDLKENNLPGDFRGESFPGLDLEQRKFVETANKIIDDTMASKARKEIMMAKKIKFELSPNDMSMVLQAIAEKVSQLERYRFERPQTEDNACSLIGEMGAYNRIFRDIVESLAQENQA